jgi:hypothetical protein
MKTDACHQSDKNNQLSKIRKYFTYSVITKEKLDLIENRTHLDLSSYRKKIKKSLFSFLKI